MSKANYMTLNFGGNADIFGAAKQKHIPKSSTIVNNSFSIANSRHLNQVSFSD